MDSVDVLIEILASLHECNYVTKPVTFGEYDNGNEDVPFIIVSRYATKLQYVLLFYNLFVFVLCQ